LRLGGIRVTDATRPFTDNRSPMPSGFSRLLLPSALLAVLLAGCGEGGAAHGPTPISSVTASPLPQATPSTCAHHVTPPASPGPQVGPRSNLPPGAPLGTGMTLFSVVVPGVLARAGTPDAAGFNWVKQHGWKSVVDVRTTDDNTYSDFVALKFQYLWLPVDTGLAPTPDQARQFLCFVIAPANQPVLVHDNSGAERVSMFIALYRYAAQGWPMDLAVKEQKLYGDSMNLEQLTFLQAWASQYAPGVIP
jgi:Tyrosine phosphatase family